MWFAANNILLMRSCNHALGEKMAGRFGWAVREWFKYKNKLGDRMIKQLSNSVIAKYCDLSMSRRSIICLSLRLRQIIDLLATDKSQYFAQPRPIIVKYLSNGWYIFPSFHWVRAHHLTYKYNYLHNYGLLMRLIIYSCKCVLLH